MTSPAIPSASAVWSAVSSSSERRCAIWPFSPRRGRRMRLRLWVRVAKWLSNSGRALGLAAAGLEVRAAERRWLLVQVAVDRRNGVVEVLARDAEGQREVRVQPAAAT